jgi:ribosome-binding protein aMBF1 (putative translation factor)
MKTRKCPVCDWEIKDQGKTVKVEGKNVVVCCDDCAEKVKTNPRQYLQREAGR